MLSTIPLLGGTFDRDPAAALETSIVGGVEGNAGKSSSSRPGGFGCSGARLFFKESLGGLGLYAIFVSDSNGSDRDESTCGDGGIGASVTDGGVKTRFVFGDAIKDGGGGTGTPDMLGTADAAAAVAAATAANSSSAFLIKSKSLKLLNVLLLSLDVHTSVRVDSDASDSEVFSG